MTAVDDFDAHQRRRGLAATTIGCRRQALGAWARWLDGADWRAVTALEVQQALDGLSALSEVRRGRGWTPRSEVAWLSNVRAFYQWAHRAGLVDNDPTVGVETARCAELLPRPIEDTVLVDGLGRAEGRMRAWVLLGAFAGLRCCEIAATVPDDISGGLLRVSGKGGRERLVPCRVDVASAVHAVGPWPGMTARNVSNRVARHLAGGTAHQLRHWYATNLYAKTGDLILVQRMLGHASVSTTQIYTGWSQERARAAVDELGAGLLV